VIAAERSTNFRRVGMNYCHNVNSIKIKWSRKWIGGYSAFDVQKDSRYGGQRRGCAKVERLQVYGRAGNRLSIREMT